LNFLAAILDKFYLKQWTIGIVSESIEDVIIKKNQTIHVKWVEPPSAFVFYADPFILDKNDDGKTQVLVEELEDQEGYGKLSKLIIDNKFNYTVQPLLDLKAHLSYPQVIWQNEQLYIIPESASLKKLNAYQFNSDGSALEFCCTIMDQGLYDATVLYFNNKFWLFGILSSEKIPHLVIYHSNQLLGPYTRHKEAVVKKGLWGVRPAGKFIQINGELYRPAQNCKEYYGKSLIIFKVEELTEEVYRETFHMEIRPEQLNKYNFGIHTINASNGKLVVDGLKRHFKPFYKIKKAILQKL